MNPRQELKDLIQRLEAEIHQVKATPQNALRIADRRRELARCVMVLARMEGRTTQTSKVRTVPLAPDHPSLLLVVPIGTTKKVRTVPLAPDGSGLQVHRAPPDDVGGLTHSTLEFAPPNPRDDPDMFLGVAGEDQPVCQVDPVAMILRRCQEGH